MPFPAGRRKRTELHFIQRGQNIKHSVIRHTHSQAEQRGGDTRFHAFLQQLTRQCDFVFLLFMFVLQSCDRAVCLQTLQL